MLERAREDAAWLAWHIGILSNVDGKHYPKSPADLLPKQASRTAPDWKAMERAALEWTVNRGGAVIKG